jgi:CRP-like cAMP-binding protein
VYDAHIDRTGMARDRLRDARAPVPHEEHFLSPVNQKTIRNRILAALPAQEFALVAEGLTRIDLHLGETLHLAGAQIEHIHFPEIGFISAMAVLSDGSPIEIGLIGAEGAAGVAVLLGAKTSYSETMCQTAGAAHRMSVETLNRTIGDAPHLRDLLLKYIHAFHVQVCQTAACNAHHEVSQRLARWLLAAHDRSGVPELSLTQDLIAVMLGMRRATVSIAAGMLQKAGVIRYQHGRITIIDRTGLESAACECYSVVVNEYRSLLGIDPAVVAAERLPLSPG